jgi:hypothetical protein
MEYIGCWAENCNVLDGGRRINGDKVFVPSPSNFNFGSESAGLEMFRLNIDPDKDLILVTRLHAINSGNLTISYNFDSTCDVVGVRTIPFQPGEWLEIATLVSEARLYPGLQEICIEPDTPGGYYVPYYHWAYQGDFTYEQLDGEPVGTFQAGAIELMESTLDYQQNAVKLPIALVWQTNGKAQGDYKVFVHLYDDVSQPPVAQMDMRPGDGTLSPGNWLPGVIRDTIEVDLTDVPPGKYHVAIGMYDPLTNERLRPDAGGDQDGRLFIGEVEIE